jgi:hypothetical protein
MVATTGGSTGVLRTTLGSTHFLEVFWRRRDNVPPPPRPELILSAIEVANGLNSGSTPRGDALLAAI